MKVSRRIMLIDDDPDDQLFFRDAIRVINPDFQCESVSNGREAFKRLETPPLPEFIFMDLNMPVMNGFDCLVFLKTHQQYKDIPVVIFTTSRNSRDISRTQDLGAKWYLTKPDDFNVLCKKLMRILQKDPVESSYTI